MTGDSALLSALHRLAVHLRPARGAWWAWALTRAAGMAYIAGYGLVAGDVALYGRWASAAQAGRLPWVDVPVEYPPGVLAVLWLPAPSPTVFLLGFLALALVADAALLTLLRRDGRAHGAVLWLVLPVLLGPVLWCRLDLFVALALVVALRAVRRARWATAALAVVVAASFKLWPLALLAVLMPLVPAAARRRFVLAAVGGCAALVAPLLAVGAGPGLRWMLGYHRDRGLEIEALPALPVHLLRLLGRGPQVVSEYGAAGFRAADTPVLLPLADGLLALAMLGVLVLALRCRGRAATAGPLVLLATIAVVVFGKVLSPQYVVWLVAVLAAVVDDLPRARAGDRTGVLVASATAMLATQWLWPLALPELVLGHASGYLAAGAHGVAMVALAVVAGGQALRAVGVDGARAGGPPGRVAAVPAPRPGGVTHVSTGTRDRAAAGTG